MNVFKSFLFDYIKIAHTDKHFASQKEFNNKKYDRFDHTPTDNHSAYYSVYSALSFRSQL